MNRRTTLLAAGSLLATPALLAQRAHAQTAAAPPAPAQAPGFYRFRVGALELTTVYDGYGTRPVEGLVTNAPLADVQKVLADSFLPTDQYTASYTLTFINTGSQIILIDTGSGGQLGPTSGRAKANMAAAGITPEQVSVILISHFHPDHINGLTTPDNQPAFPNAEVMVPDAEWDFWTNTGNEAKTPANQRGNFANVARRFAPYQQRLRHFFPNGEVLPGIHGLSAFGHTPGHTMFHIENGGQQYRYLADVTNRPELFARRPDFHVVYDFDPEMAEATRRRVLDEVSTQRMHCGGYHFPFPAHGHIGKEGEGYRFVPADWIAPPV